MSRLFNVFKKPEPVYATAINPNRLHAPLSEKALLAKHKVKLSNEGRYALVVDESLKKDTLLVGLEQSAELVLMFSFNIYYASREWNALKKHAAAKNTAIVCYQSKQDEVACLKLVKPGDSPVCSYLVPSKSIEISPTRGRLVLPPDLAPASTGQDRNSLKNR